MRKRHGLTTSDTIISNLINLPHLTGALLRRGGAISPAAWRSNRVHVAPSGRYLQLEYKTLILTEFTKYESTSGQVRNDNLIFTILSAQGAIEYQL